MGSATRRRWRLENREYFPEPRPRTMQRCPTCYGRGKEAHAGVVQVRVTKCSQCLGKGRVPIKR